MLKGLGLKVWDSIDFGDTLRVFVGIEGFGSLQGLCRRVKGITAVLVKGYGARASCCSYLALVLNSEAAGKYDPWAHLSREMDPDDDCSSPCDISSSPKP